MRARAFVQVVVLVGQAHAEPGLDAQPVGEVAEGREAARLGQLALDQEPRLAVPGDEEVHLVLLLIAQVVQLHVEAVGIAEEVAVFQQVRGDHVLEPRGLGDLASPRQQLAAIRGMVRSTFQS